MGGLEWMVLQVVELWCCGGRGNEVYISTFDWWGENEVMCMTVSIYCCDDIVCKLLIVRVAKATIPRRPLKFYITIAAFHLGHKV
jgi:hypothetical protein